MSEVYRTQRSLLSPVYIFFSSEYSCLWWNSFVLNVGILECLVYYFFLKRGLLFHPCCSSWLAVTNTTDFEILSLKKIRLMNGVAKREVAGWLTFPIPLGTSFTLELGKLAQITFWLSPLSSLWRKNTGCCGFIRASQDIYWHFRAGHLGSFQWVVSASCYDLVMVILVKVLSIQISILIWGTQSYTIKLYDTAHLTYNVNLKVFFNNKN